MHKWILTVQTHVVQGSTVVCFISRAEVKDKFQATFSSCYSLKWELTQSTHEVIYPSLEI